MLSTGCLEMVDVWSCAIKVNLSKFECPAWRLRAEYLILSLIPACDEKGDFQLHYMLPHNPENLSFPLDILMSMFNMLNLNFFT